jgi:hypothetical protein
MTSRSTATGSREPDPRSPSLKGAQPMKFVEPSHFTDPEAAARKLLEIANATEPCPGWPHLYRASQRRLPKGRRHGRAVPRRYPEGGRQRLDGAARVRNLCEIRPYRHRAVCLWMMMPRAIARCRAVAGIVAIINGKSCPASASGNWPVPKSAR